MSGAGKLAGWIAPGRTALLIIDMQVDFASLEGVIGRGGADLSTFPAALAAADRLARAARAAGVPVFFIGLQTRPETDSAVWRTWMERRGRDPAREFAVCREGSLGAAFVGPTPQPGDRVVWKPRYSGFVRTELDQQLRAENLDTLVVCGVTTECCVDQTVRDAFTRDFHVFVAGDACAAYAAAWHAHALEVLACSYAIVTDTTAVATAWASAIPVPAPP